MNYKEAIKKPKDGFAHSNHEQNLAGYSEVLGRKHCLNPEIVFEWAKKHNVNLAKYGYRLAKLNSELLLAILNDEPPNLAE